MSTNYDQMEEIWGLGAVYSDYQIDDRICYTLEGQTCTGTIIWVVLLPILWRSNCRHATSFDPTTKKNSRDIVLSGNIVARRDT